jgi:hypothetical protein
MANLGNRMVRAAKLDANLYDRVEADNFNSESLAPV